MNRSAITAFILASSTFALACSESETVRRTTKNAKEGDPAITQQPMCTESEHGSSYTNFDGTKLEVGRVEAPMGADRGRMKPYSSLRAEYEHALGVAPAAIKKAGASFGEAPERFAFEPKATAVQVYAAFQLAFDGCLTYTAGFPEFTDAPSQDTAPEQCRSMARYFWSREPTDKEIDQCAQVALVDSEAEPEPLRRWAYTCAALLSSAGFLTY